MKRLLRVFAFLLLAVFAAGTVAHAAATTKMSLGMAFVAAAAVDMDDCDGCDKTNGVTVCDQSCTQPFAALLSSEPTEAGIAAISLGQSAPHDLVDRMSPPERHPPR